MTKSRFALGSAPSQDVESGLVRWVGADGVVAIEDSGDRRRIRRGREVADSDAGSYYETCAKITPATSEASASLIG